MSVVGLLAILLAPRFLKARATTRIPLWAPAPRYGRRPHLFQCGEDLICGGGFAEPLLEHVERADVGVVAVGLAGVGDDDCPVLQIGCSPRGGFHTDLGRDPRAHQSIYARPP